MRVTSHIRTVRVGSSETTDRVERRESVDEYVHVTAWNALPL